MLFFLFLIVFIGGIIAGYYIINKYEQTISSLKLKLNLLNSELSKVVSEKKALDIENLALNFLDSENTNGILKSNSKVYLFPASISPVLHITSQDLNATILAKVLIKDTTWYFASLPLDCNINSKGWVMDDYISVIQEQVNTQYAPVDELKKDDEIIQTEYTEINND